jgi:hypothetical protein
MGMFELAESGGISEVSRTPAAERAEMAAKAEADELETLVFGGLITRAQVLSAISL